MDSYDVRIVVRDGIMSVSAVCWDGSDLVHSTSVPRAGAASVLVGVDASCEVGIEVGYHPETNELRLDVDATCKDLFSDVNLEIATDMLCVTSVRRRTPSNLLRESTSAVVMSVQANATQTVCV